jgi:hypothetical protein
MTLEDLMDSLEDARTDETLTRKHIERCLLLAYEMGMEAGRLEMARPMAQAPA